MAESNAFLISPEVKFALNTISSPLKPKGVFGKLALKKMSE